MKKLLCMIACFYALTVFGDTPSQILTFPNSVTKTGSAVTLKNDSSSPGNTKYYGTDGSGTRGFFSIPASGVTSVTGTAPIVSSGGATPAISIPVATTSANGYLASSDWNTFNGKQSGLTFPDTVVNTSGAITLKNDVSTNPGGPKYYGTDASGIFGFHPTISTISGTSPIGVTGGSLPGPTTTISCQPATTYQAGCLSSADWNTFNNKGVPGGSNGQVQFNAGGTFGGQSGFTYGLLSNDLTLNGSGGLILNGTNVNTSSPMITGNNGMFNLNGDGSVLLNSAAGSGPFQLNTDGSGQLNNNLSFNPYGDFSQLATLNNLFVGGSAQIDGSFSTDNGGITSDGNGDMTFNGNIYGVGSSSVNFGEGYFQNNLYSDGDVTASGNLNTGFGVFNVGMITDSNGSSILYAASGDRYFSDSSNLFMDGVGRILFNASGTQVASWHDATFSADTGLVVPSGSISVTGGTTTQLSLVNNASIGGKVTAGQLSSDANQFNTDGSGNTSAKSLTLSANQYLDTSQTTVNGSTSGSIVWSMPEQGTAYKKFIIYFNALNSTSKTLTYPTSFTHTPYIYGSAAPLAISSTSATTFSISTASTITGLVFVEGF